MADGDPEGKSPRKNFLSKFRLLRGKQTTKTDTEQKQNNQKQDPKQRRRAISPNDGIWPTQDDGVNSQSTNDEDGAKTNKTNETTKNYAPWGGIRHPTFQSDGNFLKRKMSLAQQKEIKKERISSIPNINENNDDDVNENNDDFFLDDELFEINGHTGGQRHRTPHAVNTHSELRMSVSMDNINEKFSSFLMGRNVNGRGQVRGRGCGG